MDRKSKKVMGYVNFPVNDDAWIDSTEGGMAVKLVVCENNMLDESFCVCFGAAVFDMLEGSLIADDQRPFDADPLDEQPESFKDIMAAEEKRTQWYAYHYPKIGKEPPDVESYLSRPYLASILMGSTGWSGYDKDYNYWKCSYNDLTEEGKALYRQVKSMYPGCELHLLTFLDT